MKFMVIFSHLEGISNVALLLSLIVPKSAVNAKVNVVFTAVNISGYALNLHCDCYPHHGRTTHVMWASDDVATD